VGESKLLTKKDKGAVEEIVKVRVTSIGPLEKSRA